MGVPETGYQKFRPDLPKLPFPDEIPLDQLKILLFNKITLSKMRKLYTRNVMKICLTDMIGLQSV